MKYSKIAIVCVGCLFSSPSLRASNNQYELSEVSITSDISKSSTPLIQAPGNILKVEQETIRDRAIPSLGNILQFEPNINFIGGPRPSAELPNIRGLNSDRILILDEGVRQNFQSGHLGRIFSDFTIMEKVEVLKGPWSALYGSGAIGGVIRFERSTANNLINRYGPAQFSELHILADTNSQLQSIRATGYAKYNRFSPLLSIRSSQNQNLLLSNGERLSFSASRDHDIYASVGVDLGANQNLNFKINRYQQNTQAPINPTLNDTQSSRLADTQVMKSDFIIDYQLSPSSDFEYKLKAYQRDTEVTQTRLSDKRLETRKVSTLGVDSWINYTKALTENLTSVQTLGLEYFQDHNQGTSSLTQTLSSFPNATSGEYGIYWQPDLKWNSGFKLTPGIRYDSFQRVPSSGNNLNTTRGNRVTRRLYSSYEFDSDQTSLIFAGWGEGFRSPRIQDLFVEGFHFPPLPATPINQCTPPLCPTNFFVPNPNLRPEFAETLEVGFKKLWRPLNQDRSYLVQLSFFNTEATDFIFQDVRLGEGQTQFINLDKVRLRGYEASLKTSYKKWISTIAYGETQSLNLLTNDPLADTPANQLSLSAQYLWSDWIRLGIDSRFIEDQNRIPSAANNTSRVTPTPGYNITDLFINFSHVRYGNWLVRGSNVFQTSFRPHGSFLNGPGANLSLSWTKSY